MVSNRGQAAAFRFIGIDREGLVSPSARMGNMIAATAKGAHIPLVKQVEGERGIWTPIIGCRQDGGCHAR